MRHFFPVASGKQGAWLIAPIYYFLTLIFCLLKDVEQPGFEVRVGIEYCTHSVYLKAQEGIEREKKQKEKSSPPLSFLQTERSRLCHG